jgi:hypothetical protein
VSVRPPRFSDDAAVAALVNQLLDAAERERDRVFERLIDQVPLQTHGEVWGQIEQRAIERARLGDFKPLAALVERENPLYKILDKPLGSEVSRIAAARLRGEFKKKGRGPPRKDLDERLAASLVYDAADLLPRIEKILRERWPGQRGHQHEGQQGYRDRAIDIAAARAGVDPGTLKNYLRRSKRRKKRKS